MMFLSIRPTNWCKNHLASFRMMGSVILKGNSSNSVSILKIVGMPIIHQTKSIMGTSTKISHFCFGGNFEEMYLWTGLFSSTLIYKYTNI